MFRLLVCGGRDFNDIPFLTKTLDRIHKKVGPMVVIHGDARGADRMAGCWARSNGLHEVKVPALWDHYSNGAGPKRNTAMLVLQPQGVVAFPGGSGTANMVDQSVAAGIPVYVPAP